MKSNAKSLLKLCFTFITSPHKNHNFYDNPLERTRLFCITRTVPTYSTKSRTEVEDVIEDNIELPTDTLHVFKKWGCTETDISTMYQRCPGLHKADPHKLQFKLRLLNRLGVEPNDLVKIVNCRPRFLSYRINHCFDEHLEYFLMFFGSWDMVRKAIVRNPSILTCDFNKKFKPTIALYERVGLSNKDLVLMLLSRPTLISRTSFDDEKMDFIRKTGISKDSKMFKYVVTIIGVSRVETLRQKVANLEKFGFSNEEVWSLFGRSPFLLTLSVEKVQRNMTFVVGTMKLPEKVIFEHPFLLFSNLDAVLKPRFLLFGNMEEMGICPKFEGHSMLTALRMKEKRFLEAFISCHPEDVAGHLMEFYQNAKGIKRLAVAWKLNVNKGFPF